MRLNWEAAIPSDKEITTFDREVPFLKNVKDFSRIWRKNRVDLIPALTYKTPKAQGNLTICYKKQKPLTEYSLIILLKYFVLKKMTLNSEFGCKI